MTEAAAEPTPPSASTAGALLRAARERQGLHIAVLATTIKVAPRKLEALEADRYDELPDPAFARALAQTVCRALKIDAAPVLALLPRPNGAARLEQVASGLNAPFRDRPGRDDGGELTLVNRPIFWAPAIVLLAAAVVYLLPQNLFGPTVREAAESVRVEPPPAVEPVAPASPPALSAEPAASEAPAPAPAEPVSPAPLPQAAPAPSTAAATPPAAAAPDTLLLLLRASEASWVEVRDRDGNVLLSRTLQAGEAVGVNGALPLRATIGNVKGTTVTFRGQAVDLAPRARDNVARISLE
ncbi:helix-turn-helix domain-containing protein [Azohydromonas sediminis]|uniref:helix-turn-helix domain-containing protein n=1 Tax=Azohydromonas sediminis TaxID=2259674 RepID=UPI000E6479E3|nr:helix-turn-helix domain-containing protein [Azohydromonas sediminis]